MSRVRLGRAVRDLRSAVSWHRRLLAAGLAAGAMAVGLHALAPAPSASVAVVAAAHDLAGGTRLRAADLRVVQLAPDVVPTGVLTIERTAVGRVLAAPVRSGEPLTDLRLVGAALVRGSAGDVVAAPVRFADAQAVRLLGAGDVIDVVAASTLDPSGTGPVTARVVARRAHVLAVPASSDQAGLGAGTDGALVVLALDRDTTTRVAAAAASGRLSFTLLGG